MEIFLCHRNSPRSSHTFAQGHKMNTFNTLLLFALTVILLTESCSGLLHGQLQGAVRSVDGSSGGMSTWEQGKGQWAVPTVGRSVQELVQVAADGNSTSQNIKSSPPQPQLATAAAVGKGFRTPPWALITTGPDGKWLCDRCVCHLP